MKPTKVTPQKIRFSSPALAALLTWGAGLALCLSFWPGIMVWDSGRQYGQAVSGQFDDWHPPLMEAIWRLLIPLMPGPGPMLILQLGLYGAALGFLVHRAFQQGHRRQAVWLAATGLFPLTVLVMATIIKDALMAATLLAAFGFLVRFRDTGNRAARLMGVALVVIASCLRFNAFLAGLPLLLLALPDRWIKHRGRLALAIAGAALLLLLAMPVANRLLQAQRSGVELSLVIFDLGGITAHGGGDAFPPLPVKHPVAVNQGCYFAERWDSYSWWVSPVCSIQFNVVQSAFAGQRIHPELFWIKAILLHPLAYAAHRLEHWNIASQFLVRTTTVRWITSASDPNEWNFRVAPNPVNRLVTAASWVVNATPFGWPCWWMTLSFGLLLLGWRLTLSREMLTLAGSALLYELGNSALSVATELRYHCWPMMATLIAMVMFIARWRETRAALRPDGRHWLLAAAPMALIAVLGLGWRWFA
ncbi:MAG TPA: hypothetical protein VFI23_14570 [Rhizomicrobium sp.]|nr:hypothetical protein [Rhizomicrobium sp.]